MFPDLFPDFVFGVCVGMGKGGGWGRATFGGGRGCFQCDLVTSLLFILGFLHNRADFYGVCKGELWGLVPSAARLNDLETLLPSS